MFGYCLRQCLKLCRRKNFSPVSKPTKVWSVKEGINSTMHEWRPYQIYFVGDHSYKEAQQSGDFMKYAEGLLTQATLYINKLILDCAVKLLVLGTTVFTHEQEWKYLRSESLNLTGFLSEDETARISDIVIALSSSPVKATDANFFAQKSESLCTKDKFIVIITSPFNYYDLDSSISLALVKTLGFPGHPCLGISVQMNSCCRVMKNLYKRALAALDGSQCFNTKNTCCSPTTFQLNKFDRSSYQCDKVPGVKLAKPKEIISECVIECTTDGSVINVPNGVACEDDTRFADQPGCIGSRRKVCLRGECKLPYDDMMKLLYSNWQTDLNALPACGIPSAP
ncbi:uncharacterized protein LOC135392883 isoform X2 [Ornithodoros turicata]|uniref:uncharacterized protein LOC135392883 isoform X2 n=1 Tax=Ornithodoros turicata TaxID=34597 RepID=UPI00313862C7